MTPPRPTVVLRRAELVRGLSLGATDLRLLIALLVRACPSSGRTWEPSERLAEALGLSDALIRAGLDRLEREGFVELQPGLLRGLPSVELGPVLVRSHEPPENLPVEPRDRV